MKAACDPVVDMTVAATAVQIRGDAVARRVIGPQAAHLFGDGSTAV